MKLTIDNEAKTLKIEGTANVEELYQFLRDHPELKDYSLLGTETVINYYNYPVIQQPIVPYYPSWPNYTPDVYRITCTYNDSLNDK